MSREITDLINRRNQCQEGMRTRNREQRIRIKVENIKRELKEKRKELKYKLKRWETTWWEEKLRECREAADTNNRGKMYKLMREIGTRGYKKAPSSHNINVGVFKSHFKQVSRCRYEEDTRRLEEILEEVEDISNTDRAREANDLINEEPEEEEIEDIMKGVKDSAPGEDNIRMSYIWHSCTEIKEKVVQMVKFMFNHRAHRWSEATKIGIMIPIYKKKGDKNECNNYRGVCLLAMASRILARIVTKRTGWWVEHLELLKENQAGCKKGRSTADATQVIMRIQENEVDLS